MIGQYTINIPEIFQGVHGFLGAIHSTKISDRLDREKWFTSKGGPVFLKLFLLDRTDPLSFGLKFPEILVELIAPSEFDSNNAQLVITEVGQDTKVSQVPQARQDT